MSDDKPPLQGTEGNHLCRECAESAREFLLGVLGWGGKMGRVDYRGRILVSCALARPEDLAMGAEE